MWTKIGHTLQNVLDAGHRTMMIGSIWMTNVTEKIA